MSKTITDHDEIRAWAEKHGAVPAAVERTHEDRGDVGIIRLMFPRAKQSEHGALVEISWDEFFAQFDESELALIVDESNFNKFVGRDTADRRAHGENDAARHRGRESERRETSEDVRREAAGTQSRGKESGDADNLKARAYRDADGNVHHHTQAYMEDHAKGGR
jgi:hypothetical protein